MQKPQIPQGVDLSQTTPLECPNCKNTVFEPLYYVELRKLSALISPTGKNEIISVPKSPYRCTDCGLITTPQILLEGQESTNTVDNKEQLTPGKIIL